MLAEGGERRVRKAVWAVTVSLALGAAAAPAAAVTVTARYEGADRYATAVSVSGETHPETSPIVWVALDFPDALAAGPAATVDHAPLLLVPQDGALPQVVGEELRRLQPEAIYVAGGEGAVSDGMVSQRPSLPAT